MNITQTNDPTHCFSLKLNPWGAVLAGALVAIGLSFLFNLFFAATGLSIISTSREGMTALAIGGLAGWLISIIFTMFLAGMTTGYLARFYCSNQNAGILFGFMTWSFALILTAIFAMQMTKFITSYTDSVYDKPPVVAKVDNTTSSPTSVLPNAYISTDYQNTTVNTQKAVKNVSYATFIMFVLFFAGALSSCMGGFLGAGFNRDDDAQNRENLRK